MKKWNSQCDNQKLAEVPNETTLAAMQEAEDMSSHPEQYPVFNDVGELMKALDEEDARVQKSTVSVV